MKPGRAFWLCIVVVALSMLIATAGLIGCARAKPQLTLTPMTTVAAEALASDESQVEQPTPIPELPVPDEEPTPTEATVEPTSEPASTSSSTPEPATPESPTEPAPTEAPSATPTEETPSEVTYVVKRGDTLGTIARLHNTTSLAIMQRNGLSNPNMIYLGQELIVPLGAVSEPAEGGKTVQHVVARGETLSYLAQRYRTTIAAIRSQNPALTQGDRLIVGTKLVITIGDEAVVVTHTVQPGEYLAGIAARYGVTSQDLIRANGLRNPNQIYVGQKLVIPQR